MNNKPNTPLVNNHCGYAKMTGTTSYYSLYLWNTHRGIGILIDTPYIPEGLQNEKSGFNTWTFVKNLLTGEKYTYSAFMERGNKI